MTTPLQVIATLVAKDGAQDRLRQALLPAIARFRAEPGCLAYALLEDHRRPGRFMTYETWADDAALAAHMTSPTMTELGPLMKASLEGGVSQDFLSVLVSL